MRTADELNESWNAIADVVMAKADLPITIYPSEFGALMDLIDETLVYLGACRPNRAWVMRRCYRFHRPVGLSYDEFGRKTIYFHVPGFRWTLVVAYSKPNLEMEWNGATP